MGGRKSSEPQLEWAREREEREGMARIGDDAKESGKLHRRLMIGKKKGKEQAASSGEKRSNKRMK